MNAITGVAWALLLVGLGLNVAVAVRSPDSDNALSWRAKWMTQARRSPLLRGAAMACLLAAIALFLTDIVVYHS